LACATADAVAVRRIVDTGGLLGVKAMRAAAIAVLTEATTSADPDGLQRAIELVVRRGVGAAKLPVSSEPRSSAIVVRCFGGFRIDVDGRPLSLERLRPQARNVLKILSLAPDRDHHRELLEDMLWPDVDHATACHRLQVAVSSVRGSFGAVGLDLRRHGESYRLCLPDEAVSDVRDFTGALSLAAAASARGDQDGRVKLREKAMALYSGDLLPDMAIDAIEVERQRLRAAAAAAACALACDYASVDDVEKALGAAQRAVDLDAGQDGAWRLMAELHERVGDVSSADYVRHQHRRVRADLAL